MTITTLILDRDGVINEDSDAFIKSPAEWIPIPGSLEAIARLSQAGFTIYVATNQSGLARGLFDEATLTQIHEKMKAAITQAGGKLEAIFFCPHGPSDHCTCRKPKPGLIEACLRHRNIPPEQAVVIGDSLRDLQAGQSTGCSAWLVLTGKGAECLRKHPELAGNLLIFDTLEKAAAHLLIR